MLGWKVELESNILFWASLFMKPPNEGVELTVILTNLGFHEDIRVAVFSLEIVFKAAMGSPRECVWMKSRSTN